MAGYFSEVSIVTSIVFGKSAVARLLLSEIEGRIWCGAMGTWNPVDKYPFFHGREAADSKNLR